MARLTTTGANLVAAAVGGGPKLEITKFVFANIPGLNHTNPEPANEPIPAPANIVFSRAPTAAGIVDENRVTYSQMLMGDVGDFSFNWIGLVYTHPVNGDMLVMFAYVPLTQKVKSVGAVSGNVITRNMVIEHLGIANATPIVVSAESWMFDFYEEYKYATTAEAEAGTAANRVMSPLRVFQAFAKFLTAKIGTAAGTVAAGNDTRITGAAQKTANLSDLANVVTARTNLGLGNSATQNVGTTAGTVAAGNDSRIIGSAQKSANLSDLASVATARTNLGLGGAATLSVGTAAGTVAAGDDSRITGAAQKSANLSDLPNAATARTNLGLGNSATQSVGTAAGTVAAGNDSRITGAAQKSANLSDLASVATARTNLGLGGAATLSVGTAAGTVAAGDDSRITGAAQKSANLSDLPNAATARTNLGLGNSATQSVGTAAGTVAAGNDSRITGAAQKSANLSDLASVVTARTNLGLGGAATLGVGTAAGTVAAGDDSRITGASQKSANLSDLPSAATARTNLGLGNSATRSVGTAAGTVMAGDDARLATAVLELSALKTRVSNKVTHNPDNYTAASAAQREIIVFDQGQSKTVTLNAGALVAGDVVEVHKLANAGRIDIVGTVNILLPNGVSETNHWLPAGSTGVLIFECVAANQLRYAGGF